MPAQSESTNPFSIDEEERAQHAPVSQTVPIVLETGADDLDDYDGDIGLQKGPPSKQQVITEPGPLTVGLKSKDDEKLASPRTPGPTPTSATTEDGLLEGKGAREEESEDEFRDAQSRPVSLSQEGVSKMNSKENVQPQTGISHIDIKGDSHVPNSKENELDAGQDGPEKKDEEASKGPVKGHTRGQSSVGVSEWSHQQLAPQEELVPEAEEDEWQPMPAFAPYDIYDDDNKLIAREAHDSEEEMDAYAGLGGAGRGYTRVQLDEDAQSATSLDENTQYLFKEANGDTGAGMEDDEQRDAVSQMQATKDLLTEGQRIAYVGMTRLILSKMLKEAESVESTKSTKKDVHTAAEAMQMWSQKMMVRLYAHMEISTAEQVMIEQLAEHGVVPADLTPTLMQNARVKNPMAENESVASPRPISYQSSPRFSVSSAGPSTPRPDDEDSAVPPPAYEEHEGDDLPEVRIPGQLPTTKNLDIDLRWTVLCDLFLTLIADSVYDARSRVLLERVGANMSVDWLEICRFEKRVTDALEMQQAAEKENWNEDEHKESRRKMALKKRYVMMGLATVGGGLVIGLSAGLLAPVIGAGLAAGFTTIGVAGTSGFLAGAGGAAIITSAAATSGGIIAVKAANRRTGAVKTFEYRPLHNNKRVNLIVTVSGWMTGKVDDVRLPYSTVDPIMGDIYSVLWEPEMLTSMGDTINILATEALTQGLQQVLGSTILIGLMAALQLPVVLTKLAYLIDNPWTVSLDRANAAGLILADSLIARNLGTRPITFVGYSLGSRVIFSCLRELAKKGAYGLVQNVYLFGSPIVANKDEYLKARTVVAGRFVNGYATNDWILGYLFRLTSGGISRVAGLAPIDGIPGLENVNVTEIVPGHMAYRTAMPRLLMEVGWTVESEEFTEIEDPDPENHQERQRELINEIEEARKELEKKEAKGKFGFFSRKKKAMVEKKDWETYQESKVDPKAESNAPVEPRDSVLFDVDAIRAELASEHLEVRELKSTLPPMKLDLGSPPIPNPRDSLRATKSFDASSTLKANESKSSPWTSPQPSTNALPHSAGPRYAGYEEDELEMTFDTSYHSPPQSAITSSNHLPSFSHPSPSPTPAPRSDRSVSLQRPELKSSTTLPTALPTTGLGHNAWADEDDEFAAHDQEEIQMTFA